LGSASHCHVEVPCIQGIGVEDNGGFGFEAFQEQSAPDGTFRKGATDKTVLFPHANGGILKG
jgi:hypothetical protein